MDVPVINKNEPDYAAGDYVNHVKYGRGEVLDIRAAGADYEVTVHFSEHGKKKFMAHLAKLEKIELNF
jgi:DNA helicase-2/ATP-dependent DNA helicase PcrA